MVEDTPGAAASLEAALHSTGILTTTVAAAQIPRSSAELAAYSAVVLVNVPASSLGQDEMALLQAVTRDLGTGLVVIGGSDSYGPGGYARPPLDTPLALHIMMLGDGDSRDAYQPVVETIPAPGVTVSTVAVGFDSNGAATMQAIAGWGHGRYYQSTSIQDVPQIFLKETNEALKPWVVEGQITPRLSSLADVLPGVPLDSFPVLTGYVATTPRAAADVLLKSPQGDPLLATWRYALPRGVACTTDAQGRWTADLLRWPSANRFFGDMVRYG